MSHGDNNIEQAKSRTELVKSQSKEWASMSMGSCELLHTWVNASHGNRVAAIVVHRVVEHSTRLLQLRDTPYSRVARCVALKIPQRGPPARKLVAINRCDG